MTDGALVKVRVSRVLASHLAWAEGQEFSLPGPVLDAMLAQGCRRDASGLAIPAHARLTQTGAAAALRDRAAFTDSPPVSARLPVSYQAVPGWARALAASAIGRLKRRSMHQWAAFPTFPLDLSADFVADLEQAPRPAVAATPVLVSHDIDSPEGLRNLVVHFLPREEAVGARSSNYIVPCAWPIDDALASDVRRRGHEIGVHGTDHSNRTPFLNAGERGRRLDRGREFGDRYGAIGYRAPSLLRTRALLEDLAPRYRYDSSIPTSGGLFPVPNNGCASARPYQIGKLTEIPVSMPRDGSLRFLGYNAREIAAMWIDCAERIADSGGVVVLLTHCEGRFSGNPAMLAAYERFLAHIASAPRFRFALPADVLAPREHAHVH
jgi:peptidoglycan/xylan/chitin deacetylase (PgdA/CDA1 family)